MTAAVEHRTSIIIIGAGFGGIGLAMRLRARGVDDFVMLERGDDVGGVWRDNTYPGAACDVPALLYSFSFAPWSGWSRRYAPQTEILSYLRHCVEAHDLGRQLRLNTEVVSAVFDESTALWRVATASGATYSAPVLVTACGQLSNPQLPRIDGMHSFAGPCFHSARWPVGFDPRGKRIAVIGTGASAIQFVPEIAAQARQLYLYQRTPPYVIAKSDRVYSAATRARLARWPLLQRLARAVYYLQHEFRALGFVTMPALLRLFRGKFRRSLHDAVADPALRARLTPDYALGCKRILISNDYYPALARANVEVIADEIAAIEPNAVRSVDGRAREIDALILATGFAATEFLTPLHIVGRGGRVLHEQWREGAEAHLGTLVSGFPNLFVLYGPNTNLGHNSIVYMLESQYRYLFACLNLLRERGARWMDVRAEVQQAYNSGLQRDIKHTVFAAGCRSWYQNARGKHINNWPGYTLSFRWRTRRVWAEDFEFAAPCANATPL